MMKHTEDIIVKLNFIDVLQKSIVRNCLELIIVNFRLLMKNSAKARLAK
jgi:hypothetical protein